MMAVVAIIAVGIAFLLAITVLLRETAVRIVGSDVVIYHSSMRGYADGNGRRALVRVTTASIPLALIAMLVGVFAVACAVIIDRRNEGRTNRPDISEGS
jgi:Na+/H+ antiporter NhaB